MVLAELDTENFREVLAMILMNGTIQENRKLMHKSLNSSMGHIYRLYRTKSQESTSEELRLFLEADWPKVRCG